MTTTQSPDVTPDVAPDATTSAGASAARAGLRGAPGRWLHGWDPENRAQWDGGGRAIARRNLWLSIFAEFLGFGVFALWGIAVPMLAAWGYTGPLALSNAEQFWLVSIPILVGATMRIPYTFAVPLVGGRNWTVISALLLLAPTVGLALAVSAHAPFPVLLVIAALAGFGGGNFASSMTNISFFYPAAEKGAALGLNAAGGNLGTAAVQFTAPLVVLIGATTMSAGTTVPNLPAVGWVFVPFVLLAAMLAWRFMDNVADAKADPKSFAAAVRRPQTWLLSLLYIGTFGSFIGFAGAFPKLLTDAFPEASLKIAFLGALVGSLSRPLGGIVADRVGGWVITVISFAGMALSAGGAIFALQAGSLAAFMISFVCLFVFTGIGNGSIYRMIPAVFAATEPDRSPAGRLATLRLTGGAIGIVGAIGAYGGFVIPQGFSLSMALSGGSIVPALLTIIGVYLIFGILTWRLYGRGFGARI